MGLIGLGIVLGTLLKCILNQQGIIAAQSSRTADLAFTILAHAAHTKGGTGNAQAVVAAEKATKLSGISTQPSAEKKEKTTKPGFYIQQG